MDEATEGSTPLPPPPPSGLVGYEVATKPLNGLFTTISVLIPITAGLGLLFALLNELALDDARSFLAGAISETEFVASYGPGLTLQLAQTLTQLGAGISVTSRTTWPCRNLEAGVGDRWMVRSPAHSLRHPISHVPRTMESD
jgi:hypothetical protein